MSQTIRTEKFAKDYFAILDEYMTLFEMLETITAVEASRPVLGDRVSLRDATIRCSIPISSKL